VSYGPGNTVIQTGIWCEVSCQYVISPFPSENRKYHMLPTIKAVRNSSYYKPNDNVEKSLQVSEYCSQYMDLQISGATVT